MNEITQSKTLVLVVGAGASKEVNLPVGAELRTKIARALDIQYENGLRRISGDAAIDEAFRALAKEHNQNSLSAINPYLHASRRIRDAMPQAISIDNFIDAHRDNEIIATCGKLAITRCILQAEAESSLFINQKYSNSCINFANLQNTWFNKFFQLLSENCQKSEIGQRLSQVAIISFNYDRCVLHYLHKALQNYYGMTPESAADALTNLQIFHPYGSVGHLPWQKQSNGIEYGSNISGEKLLRVSEGIRTFTEGIDPEHSDIVRIQNTLKHADKVVFLGFAFHRLNLQLLYPSPSTLDLPSPGDQLIYATAYGISSPDQNEIKNELMYLRELNSKHIHMRPSLTCNELFSEFWRSLTLLR